MKERENLICVEKTALGIEIGSTRIKAVLIDDAGQPLATGSYDWENQFVDGVWTYELDEVWHGIQESFSALKCNVRTTYGIELTRVGSIGISAMMHGYLVFDEDRRQLVPFRTWRNTMTAEAAEQLSALFRFNIAQRWSIAHLYQAILNQEEHVGAVAFMTTLSGYVHWKLTGKKVLGIGDASGMFPIDSGRKDYHSRMMEQFDSLIQGQNIPWKLQDLLPTVLVAGDKGGCLTKEGARLLDRDGRLEEGIELCPPEGDAGTGMVATNSVTPGSGNVSAGTSIFGMVVMEKELSDVHPEVDLVTTPDGSPVAMAHCNNCSSDINAWVSLFEECLGVADVKLDKQELYTALFTEALRGEHDGGGLLAYNYFSGEHVTGMEEGRPLLVRLPEAKFNLANFMRTQIYAAFATLKIGLDVLVKEENVVIRQITGHGGLFKTPKVGQKMLAAVINAPVAVMKTAGEGGAWGVALLAAYMMRKEKSLNLGEYLEKVVFDGQKGTVVWPDKADVEGFERFMLRYQAGLSIERMAINQMKRNI